MLLLLALPSASAVSICVPEAFQHWTCDDTHATLAAAYAAVDGSPGQHTIHLRWDVNEPTLLDLDGDDDLVIIGHAGPTPRSNPTRPEYPRIQQIKMNAQARLELRQVEVWVPTDQYGLEALGTGGNFSSTELADVWFVRQAPTTSTNKPMMILSEDAQLTASRSHWSEVVHDSHGAHLNLQGGSASFVDCTFSDATGVAGGAINAADGTTLSVEDCTFTSNTATDPGGAAIHLTGVDLTVVRTRFEDNQTTNTGDREGGGAISINDHGYSVSITESLFCSNSSATEGGAIYKRRNGSVDVDRTVFYSNSSRQGAFFYARDDSDFGSGATTDFSRISSDSNRSSANNDDGIYINGYAGGDSNNFDYLTVRESILEARNDTFWHIEGGRSVTDNRFTQDDVRLSTDGSESGNLYSNPPTYPANACSFEAFTPPCDDLQAVDHPLGAVLSCSTPDQDGDGLMDHEELARGTDPFGDDSDLDGIPDGVECPPAATDPLTNPGFEVPVAGAFTMGLASFPEAQVPGWSSNNGTITLADATLWGNLNGNQALQLGAGQVLTQLVRAEPGEQLVFRARVRNGPGVGGTFSVATYPEGGSPGLEHDFLITSGTTEQIEAPVTMPATGGVVVLQMSAESAALFVDQVYLGPPVDPDGDDLPNCLDDDSDGDGVLDQAEYGVTDPLVVDTDGDGNPDTELDPVFPDSDGDGLTDDFEEAIGTDPDSPDSDGDGVDDGVECQDGGLLNGSFELMFGGALPSNYGASHPPSELPGWTASPAAQYWIGAAGYGIWPDSAAGAHVGLLASGTPNRWEQTIDAPPVGLLHWTFAHRGRFDAAEVQIQIDDTGSLVDEAFVQDDLEWVVQSGTFTSTGAPITVTFIGSGGQSFLDAIAIYPDSSVASNGQLYCRDANEQPVVDPDDDGDGYPLSEDCDDTDNTVFPGATETCNEVDDDCDGDVDDGVQLTFHADVDGDLYGDPLTTIAACTAPAHYVADGTDCDDDEGTVYPDATELCDGLDNDCDGQTDEGLTPFTHYLDEDGDGFGGPIENITCDPTPPSGHVDQDHAGDCADDDPAIFPGATELCDDVDNDCDTETDEGLPGTDYYLDHDGDGWGVATDVVNDCAPLPPTGYAAQVGDCVDSDPLVFPTQTEACNDIDDDCDSEIDEGLPTNTYYADGDDDGYGDPTSTVVDCDASAPSGTVANDDDCDDHDPTINPAADEICDTIDNDCNGTADDGLPTTPYYTDADGDGFGTTPVVARCETTAPAGLAETDDDCDDTRDDVNPGADEICDPIDHDCDGNTQLGAINAIPFYLDQDGDGFGPDATVLTLCTAPSGYVDAGGDCADDNPNRNPDADELCNDIDDDCDGQTDEDATDFSTFYLDFDGDQFGVTGDTVEACDRPDGYAAQDQDCDDMAPTVYPGAPELCDDLDNDCDGLLDAEEDIDYIDFYVDADGDGYGDDQGTPTLDCIAPAGQVGNNLDCDDTSSAIRPTAVETCDGVDTNCSGDESDANNPSLFFDDNDGDGWGNSLNLIFACTQPSGTVTTSGDCDDNNAANAPGAIEVCDGQDNNCNGAIDSDAETAPLWYQDLDGDGFGIAGAVVSFCTQPPGYAGASGDCDDALAAVYPQAPEICDGLDNDCDGLGDLTDPDGPPVSSYYLDADEDGFGDGAAVEDCAPPSGHVEVDGDCDDGDELVYPGAPEACTGIDNNCDGTIDNDLGWLDADGDGYGAAGTEPLCNSAQPTADNDQDCEDTDETIHPAAEEVCGNDIDENCDGVDDDCDARQIPATGCKCDVGGPPSALLGGMLLVLFGLRRRREAA